MEMRIQVVAILGSAVLLVIILELVRQRRLLERYALLWLFSSLVLLGLAVWNDALSTISTTIGIRTPSNALFLIAFGFVLVLLLHFSLAVSRLSDQSKVLAQKLAILEERARQPAQGAETEADRAESARAERAAREPSPRG
jgi:hypothetical protein